MSENSLDLDNLAELLNRSLNFERDNFSSNNSNISTNISSNSIPEMANREINISLFKLDLDSITPYDGSVHTLNIFINSCERIIAKYFNNDNHADPINDTIYNCIIGKFRGRALLLVGNRIEIQTWAALKETLISTFADQRSVECLIQDLLILRPLKNETTFNFGQRCQDTRELIRAKVNLQPGTAAEKLVMNRTYDNLALNTFIRHIPHHTQVMVRIKNPSTIEEALAIVIEEENFKYSQNMSHSLNVAQRNPTAKISPGNNLFKPANQPLSQQYSYNSNNQNNYQNQFQQYRPPQQYKTPFPQGPINIKPTYGPQQKLPTNQQVFGNPQRRPMPQQDRPIPMSTSTINSAKKNFSHFQRPHYNHFRPTGPPNFTFQELHYADQYDEFNNDQTQDETFDTYDEYDPELDPNLQEIKDQEYCDIPIRPPQEEPEQAANFPVARPNPAPV